MERPRPALGSDAEMRAASLQRRRKRDDGEDDSAKRRQRATKRSRAHRSSIRALAEKSAPRQYFVAPARYGLEMLQEQDARAAAARPAPLGLTLDDIDAAAALIRDAMPPTPAFRWPLLCARLGVELTLKHENHTPIGAFKVRGGLTYVDALRRRAPHVDAAGLGDTRQPRAVDRLRRRTRRPERDDRRP